MIQIDAMIYRSGQEPERKQFKSLQALVEAFPGLNYEKVHGKMYRLKRGAAARIDLEDATIIARKPHKASTR